MISILVSFWGQRGASSLFFHVKDIDSPPVFEIDFLDMPALSDGSFSLLSLLTPCIEVSHTPSVLMIHQHRVIPMAVIYPSERM